jgi:hypothetical protein
MIWEFGFSGSSAAAVYGYAGCGKRRRHPFRFLVEQKRYFGGMFAVEVNRQMTGRCVRARFGRRHFHHVEGARPD